MSLDTRIVYVTIGDTTPSLFFEPINVSAPLEDGQSVNVKITHEGVIIDAYDARGDLVGTVGMTYDEWFESLL